MGEILIETFNIITKFDIYDFFFYKMSINLFNLGCPSWYNGKNCSNHQCSINCKVTKDCDMFTGQCKGGCKPGWTGNNCDQGNYDNIEYLKQNKKVSKSI